MAKLIVKSKGISIQEIALEEGSTYSAGRRDGSDILLPAEKGISRDHFKIYFENGAWMLKVISTYGKVYSSGVEIELTALEQGQKFQVDPFEFEFIAYENSMILSEPAPPNNYAEVQPQVPFAQGSALMAMDDEKTMLKPVSLQAPYLKFLNTLGEVRELLKLEGQGPWVSGREGQIPILISDARVSRRQFEISLIQNNYYIKDLGSSNGTFLNEEMISNIDPQPLRSGDQIRVLENELLFELRDPQFEKLARSNELSIVQPTTPDMYTPQNMSPMVPQPQWAQASMEVPRSHFEDPGNQTLIDKFNNLDPKKKMIYAFVAIALIMIVAFGDLGKEKTKAPEVEVGQTPFDKLTKVQQNLVKNNYNYIKSYKMQNKYENCIQMGQQILDLLPNGYEDVNNISKDCQREKLLVEEMNRQSKEQKEAADREMKIQNVANLCEKQINANITKSILDSCLQEAILLDPMHQRIVNLQQQVDNLEREKLKQEQDHQAYMEKVESLQKIFNHAEGVAEKNISPYDKIIEYEKVLASQLPDPRGLKNKSKEKISSIKNSISSKTDSFVATAKSSYASGDIKRAIASLKQAKQVDPQNTEVEDLMGHYILENKQKLRPLYEESVIEERFGNIEAAIERWKKIIDQDNSDGEYYFKAYKKLKNYGALSK